MANRRVEIPAEQLQATVKERLAARGAKGIRGLARKFKIMDDDGNRQLDKYEFSKALAEMGLVVNKLEFEELMRHYDADGDGTISFDEFLYAVRGNLSPAREQLVEKAFQKLDIDNNGVLTLADIREVYDASGHPEVLSGKKTEEEILEDFLYSMEGAAVIPDSAAENRRDGQVTMKEFKEYYACVGASIDTDDEFALMMNNAWKFNA